jgi:hypothetical protein
MHSDSIEGTIASGNRENFVKEGVRLRIPFEISIFCNTFHAITCPAERMEVTNNSLGAFDPFSKATKAEFDELLSTTERDFRIMNRSEPQRKWKQIIESRQLSVEK